MTRYSSNYSNKYFFPKYLNINLVNDTDGVLQDIHWYEGIFGYFPTYALGAMISSQIKYNYPYYEDFLKKPESENIKNIANWLKNNIGLIRSDLVALIDELGKRVFEEMDYLNEAENAEKFRNLHLHNSKIAVPKIYKETTSRRVLTMEWIEGTKLTNLEGVKNLGIDPDEMIEIWKSIKDKS